MTKHTMVAISAKDAIATCPMADNMKNTTNATIPTIMSWLCDFIFYFHYLFLLGSSFLIILVSLEHHC
jgi:hypothetical protein